jgi:hypothetical protein
MSDPEIIKLDAPHKVSIAEGATNAVGKKAEVGESSIRKVLSDGSNESNQITTNDEELKGKKMPLSLDDEITLAREALQTRKDLRVEKEATDSSDELRAAKDGVKSDKYLSAEKAGVSLDDELRGAKEAFNASKDLQAEKASVDPSGDLRAAKEGVQASNNLTVPKEGVESSKELRAEKEGVQSTNNLRVPKEGVNPEGDLTAPKEKASANKGLRAPKENAKADTDLRAPKEGVNSNVSAALASSDPLVSVSPTTSNVESATTSTSNEVAPQAPLPLSKDSQSVANTADDQEEEPEMDFPARVVHLKIENDNLRNKLDKLESAP